MAAFLKEKLGIESELIEGGRGEFTVLVGEKVVAKKGWIRFPTEEKILAEVSNAMS